MIKPAICYKADVEKALAEKFYTDEMMYYRGCLDSSLLEVDDNSEDGRFQYAVLNGKGDLIGFISYWVDYYSSCAYGFGIFSFNKGNPVMGRDLFYLLEELLKTLHRVEFRAIEGNPAIRGYDHFLERHKDVGRKHILTDTFKDRTGKYRNEYIYEFVN